MNREHKSFDLDLSDPAVAAVVGQLRAIAENTTYYSGRDLLVIRDALREALVIIQRKVDHRECHRMPTSEVCIFRQSEAAGAPWLVDHLSGTGNSPSSAGIVGSFPSWEAARDFARKFAAEHNAEFI